MISFNKFTFGFILLGGILFSLTVGGCSFIKSDKDTSASNKLAATDPASIDKSAPPNTPAAKCEDMIGKMKDDIAGGKGSLPEDFPAPPKGSTLCGQADLGKGIFYLNTTMSDDEIINYYHDALAGQGYSVERITNEAGGDLAFGFSRPNVMSGYVSTKGDKDGLSLKFRDFFSIGYDLIKK